MRVGGVQQHPCEGAELLSKARAPYELPESLLVDIYGEVIFIVTGRLLLRLLALSGARI